MRYESEPGKTPGAPASRNGCSRLAWAAMAVLAMLPYATTVASERSGEEVVQKYCAACHAIGKDGAPQIGDKRAWGKLAARGLTDLTQSAIAGIRKMPAHGGSADASDLDISRAITYMINKSGGHWVEPADKSASISSTKVPPERGGRQIVQMQCSKCHLTGENGAPKIGDRDAWIQRLKRGMDDVVRSAFNGHGPMPARGGLADIEVNEMRNAITYMFNPSSENVVPPIVDSPARRDANHRIIGNMEVFFGIVSAESIRDAQKNPSVAPIASIPAGDYYYHVNVALRDRTTNIPITNAIVDVRVENLLSGGETKSLDILAINRSISYGRFFRLPAKGHYSIIVNIRSSNSPQAVEAKFDFNRN